MDEGPREPDLTVASIREAIGGGSLFGDPVEVYPVGVTAESLALSWARQRDAPEGALVVVDQELSARPRRGPPWISAAGKSVAFSVVVRPDLPADGEGLLWLLASAGAAAGIEEVGGVAVRLKWPDDLLMGGARLGCVKVDAHLGPGQVEHAVLTVRINALMTEADFPPEIRPTATSLALHGIAASRVAVIAAALRGLERRYGSSVAELLATYRARCDTIGERVVAHLMPAGEAAGVAEDVDERGHLVIRTGEGPGAIGVDRLKRLEVG
jgi:BirA family biotin operon repressor/biotin-[acetyl-CoA-carboxylase] ligase